MSDTKWDYSIDGQLEDERWPRIDGVDWPITEKFGLDSQLVGLATGTEHRDTKIALSHQLIEIHNKHRQIQAGKRPSNVSGLLPEKVLDRLVYEMISVCGQEDHVPRVLMRLLALRLNLSEKPRASTRDHHKYRKLLHLVAENPTIGKNKAAAIVGISPNTAKKWMNEPYFRESATLIRKHGGKRVS